MLLVLGIALTSAYNGRRLKLTKECNMSEESNNQDTGDGTADAIAATAVISIVVLTLYLWLSGMPS